LENAEQAEAMTPLSQSERAYRQLEKLIITMQLAPGALVSEAELAEKMGLGRTPVREALQRLAGEHLVEIEPRRGIRISPIDVKQQLRLHEVRSELELLAATLAAKRAGRAMRARFSDLSQAFVERGADDYAAFLEIDSAFNTCVGQATDNAYLVAMLGTLHGLSRRFWHYYAAHEQDLPQVAGMHAKIADAIARGSASHAADAVRVHMDYIRAFTLALID
jgi:DNA-binding GntR family transcriptional regulator